MSSNGASADSSDIRPALRSEIDKYVIEGIAPSETVSKVLSNELRDIVAGCPVSSLLQLPGVIRYCWKVVPVEAWGSRRHVIRWMAWKQMQSKGHVVTLEEVGEHLSKDSMLEKMALVQALQWAHAVIAEWIAHKDDGDPRYHAIEQIAGKCDLALRGQFEDSLAIKPSQKSEDHSAG